MINFNNLKEQLLNDSTSKALKRLYNLAKLNSSSNVNKILLLGSRYKQLESKSISHIISNQEYTIELNQINNSALLLIDQIKIELSANSKIITEHNQPEFNFSRANINLEKVINGNTFHDIFWLETGINKSKSVCRILVDRGSSVDVGTGFIFDDNIIMTNNHVIQNKEDAKKAVVQFKYENNALGEIISEEQIKLNPELKFYTNEELDFTIVSLNSALNRAKLEISSQNPNVGDFISIIQHPNGGPKKVVTSGSRTVKILDYKLQYTTDTMPGSSGSPVFNSNWEVIALHHASTEILDPITKKYTIANQGILIEKILANINTCYTH